jgi:hypothetical protein
MINPGIKRIFSYFKTGLEKRAKKTVRGVTG